HEQIKVFPVKPTDKAIVEPRAAVSYPHQVTVIIQGSGTIGDAAVSIKVSVLHVSRPPIGMDGRLVWHLLSFCLDEAITDNTPNFADFFPVIPGVDQAVFILIVQNGGPVIA